VNARKALPPEGGFPPAVHVTQREGLDADVKVGEECLKMDHGAVSSLDWAGPVWTIENRIQTKKDRLTPILQAS
jgi:hypothetical protein